MSASSVTLKYLLLAEDHLSKSLKGAGSEIDQTGKKASGMSTKLKVGLAAAGVAAVGFANASINKFKQVTVESRGIQRALGGTLEEASRFREAAILAGVDAGTFTKSAQKLDKTLVSAAKSTKTSADMAKTLGFNFLDAHGKVKPMGELLPKISDKFASMPDGAEKTALAMQLFGKAGNSMLPFLGKGSAGIAELEKQSDKFGTTLNDGAIDALSKSREQSRQFTAAMDGLKVQIGAQLLPIMNKLIGFIQSYVIPIFQKASAFVREHQHLMAFLAIAIGTIVVAWKIWTAVLAIWNAVMDANPIAIVIIAIAALAAGIIYAYKHSETFRKILQGVWDFLKRWGPAILALFLPVIGIPLLIWQHWSQIKGFMARVWNTVWPYLKTWGPVALAVLAPFIGIPLLIWQHFSKIKGFIGGVFDWVKNKISAVIGWILGKIEAAIGAIQGAIDKVNEFLGLTGSNNIGGSVLDNILNPQGGTAGPHKNHRAGGGPVMAGVPYIVGERRPELFVPDSNGYIVPKVPTGTVNVRPAGGSSSSTDAAILRLLASIDRRLAEQSGDVYLDSNKVGTVMGRQADRLGRGF